MTFYSEYTHNKELNVAMYLAVTAIRILPILYYLVEYLISVNSVATEFTGATLGFLLIALCWVLLSTRHSKF